MMTIWKFHQNYLFLKTQKKVQINISDSEDDDLMRSIQPPAKRCKTNLFEDILTQDLSAAPRQTERATDKPARAITCYNCNLEGHVAVYCPSPRRRR